MTPLLLHLLACTPETPVAKPVPPPPPDLPGPFLVGTALDAAAREDGTALPLQVWFPAATADDDRYAYDDLYTARAQEYATPDCGARRPVVLFSHGNAGLRWQSLFLAEQLASHGWIVAAPDHVGNTIFDARPTPRAEVMVQRPKDMAASWSRLLELSASGGSLEGCVDPEDGFAIVGHSFGGFTALVVAGAALDGAASAAWCASHPGGWLCEDMRQAVGEARLDLSHPKAWAAVPMTPAGYEALVGGLPDIEAPTLVLGGDQDTLTTMDAQVRPIYDSLQSERALGTLLGAGHYTFSDACAFLGTTTYEDCSPPYVAPELAHRVVNGVTLAWLSRAHGENLWPAWLPPEEDGITWEAP